MIEEINRNFLNLKINSFWFCDDKVFFLHFLATFVFCLLVVILNTKPENSSIP